MYLRSPFPGFKVEFYFPFGFCPPKVGPVVCIAWDLCWVFFVCLLVCLIFLTSKAEWDGNPVCWWLCLYFYFVYCLDELSCTGCYWWLDDPGCCIQVVSFVWVLTILYSLGLVLWYSRVLESVLTLQRLRVWSLVWMKIP